MEMEHNKRVIAERRRDWADDMAETLQFHEALFEELGCEMNLMADIIIAMDRRIDRLEEELAGRLRGGRFRRLGRPSSF